MHDPQNVKNEYEMVRGIAPLSLQTWALYGSERLALRLICFVAMKGASPSTPPTATTQ